MTPEPSQKRALSVQWEELTASDFPAAVKQAKGVCVLPIGVIEKHGAHLPLGTDMIAARTISIQAAQREYAVVFPHYYFGQIYEAKHQPGCITIRPHLLSELLQDVCEDIARNGLPKILILNGHAGNTSWLNFFCQRQLAQRHQYVIYVARRPSYEEIAARLAPMRKTDWDGHADELETSWMMVMRPDLVQLTRAGDDDGRPQGRLKTSDDAFTAIFWYADYPDHYAGDARPANRKLGELALEGWVAGLARVIGVVKKDRIAQKLQDEFYARAEAPLPKPARSRRR